MLRQRLARLVTKAMGYRMVGEVPPTGILVGAPHTSNWDFASMLLVMWYDGQHPRVLVKQELFVGPLGWIMKAFGGIEVDRKNPRALVERLTAEAKSGKPFRLVIAAEGTRGKAQYWKSGFRRIARETGLPISLAFLDRPTKTLGFGPTFHPTDDVKADMDLVRAFYADKPGWHPDKATVPRLREEDDPAAR